MANPIRSVLNALTGTEPAVTDAATKTLEDAEARLRGEYDRLHAERARLLSSLPPREEVFARADAAVDAIGSAWRQQHGQAVVGALSGRVEVDAAGQVQVRPATLEGLRGPLTFERQCAGDPDRAKAALRAIIASVNYDAGPPRAELQARLATLDQDLAAVVARHETFVDSTGGQYEHLSETRHRRWRADRIEEQRRNDAAANREFLKRESQRRGTR